MTMSKIMKSRQWLVAILLLASAALAIAQKKSNDASKVVLALESKWNDAYKRGNIDRLNVLLAEDFIITVETARPTASPATSRAWAALPNMLSFQKWRT